MNNIDEYENDNNHSANGNPELPGEEYAVHGGHPPFPHVPIDPYVANAQPAHGWLTSPVSRAEFAFRNNWLSSWLTSEMEGMKNFPEHSIAPLRWFDNERTQFGAPFPDSDQFANDGGAVPRTVPDGFIISGGRADTSRNIVNFTDNELFAARGVRWPVTPVVAGGTYPIFWHTTVWHPVRGYRYFITKDGWDQNMRLRRADLELTPFQSVFNRHRNHWGPDLRQTMPAISPQNVRMPMGKRGRHIILAVWLVADSAAGFYQALDVDFG
ncbi:lytic polysaccharide monooxygenase auxiliary activity family 9 protein [Acerihabitans sp. TG2]|uniref:lytic polysaccharide monooxygenase auxiliary activity family 9 protein n=1 Tax=Acerihabitans sp. TG2 TaxID=3096008 RepID=UPI002B22F3B9|nr:lytic polysaccharide monooxygenase auxiliary activity family 9 protein [Acerihabitans sp. TG2]MEA9392783.1 lytic polysaccharide monooxygenase auxiliary activity family 9 protein [Acerihabitans sp. TG2]